MSASNRSSQIIKMHKVLKKHYTPVAPDPSRTVLQHLLFASCLENAPYDAAERAFAALSSEFFDLNEARVSTGRELAEVISTLPDAEQAALRVKNVLQSVFESIYSFDIDDIKKENLGQATAQLQKHHGVTPFAVAYVTQAALGGHAIPLSRGALAVLVVLDIASEEDAEKHHVPGLERAIPKNKGVEFGSLLHQVGVGFDMTPFSPNVRKVLLDIDPECKERFPKRGAKTADADSDEADEPAPPKKKAKKKAAAADAKKPQKAPAKKKSAKKAAATAKKAPGKRLGRRKPR